MPQDFYIPNDWTRLAYIDEGDAYDVDAHGIYKTPEGQFALLGATGCSCWDGDYELQGTFDTLDELEVFSVSNDGDTYIPSPALLNQLLEDARASV